MSAVEPLQTHGLFHLVWQPPCDGQFCSYSKRDEAWMKPLGLGRMVKVSQSLFDVRMRDGTLAGYSEMEPRYEQHHMVVSVVDRMPVRFHREDEPSERPSFSEVTVEIGRYAIGSKTFCCWMVGSAGDAAQLLRVGFIKVIGEDNIEQVIHDVEIREYRNRLEMLRRIARES